MLAVTFRLVTFCFFFFWLGFCVPSFRVCGATNFFFCWSSFVCWMDRKREKYNSMTIVTFVQFCFCYTILPIFFTRFFFFLGEEVKDFLFFFSLVGWRASLVNASRRRPSSKGVICGYQLARTIYFIPVQSQTVRNHLIFYFFLIFLTMMTQ